MNNKTKRISLIAVITAIIAAFLTSAIVYADDNISIENTFKDPVFRDAVALQYDTDGDGELSPDERSVEVMIVSGLVDELANSRGVDSDTLTISSLEGIECFSNLKVLRCNDIGELDSLDVSALTSLETLNCSDDGLTSLDLSANTELRVLHCCSNEFTSLDFTANTKLEFLHCYANLELESLNVSGLANLEELRCDGCKINSLDLTTNTSLYKLNCSYNHIAKIDLSSTAATSLTNYHLGNQTISLELTYSDGKITAPIDLDADSVYATSLDSDGTAYADGAFFTTEYSKIKDGFTYDYSTGKSGCAEMKVSVSVYHTHTYAVTASDFENKKLTINCQICGGDEHILDAELATVTDEPSCTAAGKTTKTLTAQFDGKTYTDVDEIEIPALNHDYVPVVTPPTCTEQGYTTYTCSRCDDSYVANYTDALNHTAGETVIENEVPATCTADGSYDEVVYCTTCNEELSRETKTVEKLGHDLGEWTVTAPAVPVTCMTDGKAAIETCYCSRCDYYENRGGDPIAALNHNYKAVVVAPTCTAKGYTKHTCTRCNDSYTDSETAALGHKWNSGVVTVDPTTTSEGKKKFTCTLCNAVRYETIPKLKVSEVTPNEKEADSAKVNKTIKKPTQIHTISLNKKKQFYIYFNAVKGAQNYRIMYRKVGDKGWKKSWTKGKTEFTIKNLKANGLYEFKFAAYRKNAKGKWERGGYSTTSYRYYYKAVITKTKVARNTVTVNWKRNKNANYYTVEYATNREMKNSKKVNISPNSKTSYKIKGLKKGKKYFIRIRAVKKTGGKSYIGEFSTRKAVTIK